MNNVNDSKKNYTKRAIGLAAILVILAAASALFLFLPRSHGNEAKTAYIYQNGTLMETIDLSAVTTPYTFTVPAPHGGFNTIEVHPQAIRISDADCPDRLCVAMGSADGSLLPIVCLPHALVIEVRPSDDTAPDIISY